MILSNKYYTPSGIQMLLSNKYYMPHMYISKTSAGDWPRPVSRKTSEDNVEIFFVWGDGVFPRQRV